MKKILLTGANGQLGQYVQKHANQYPELEIIPCTREELDLSDISNIQDIILKICPDVVINAAAYTAVDRAEEERELAMCVNGLAVAEIAKACEKLQASLIHISTDYVFDGEKQGAYLPEDQTNPINHYGETKLKGEQLALEHCSHAQVVRTSWVHSEIGINFETTMKRLFKEREVLKVVDDQIGKPTHASDLAMHCLTSAVLTASIPLESAITHYTGNEIMSWCGLAKKLLQSVEDPATKEIIPIPSSEYPTPAKRPKSSVLK